LLGVAVLVLLENLVDIFLVVSVEADTASKDRVISQNAAA